MTGAQWDNRCILMRRFVLNFMIPHRRSPLVSALLLMAVSYILFQVFNVILLHVILQQQGVAVQAYIENLADGSVGSYLPLMLANALSMMLGLGAGAMVGLTVLQEEDTPVGYFTRLPGWPILLGVFGAALLFPLVHTLGVVNGNLDLPDWMDSTEGNQTAILTQMLTGKDPFLLKILLLAVAPALFEEFLFRGVVQPLVQSTLGGIAAVFFSGGFFALYHLRFSQILPLFVLGTFLAFLAWTTRSLWVPVVVHFAYNASLIVAGKFFHSDQSLTETESFVFPVYIVLIASIAAVLVLRSMLSQARHTKPKPL